MKKRRPILIGCVVVFVACACVGAMIQFAAPKTAPLATRVPATPTLASTDEPTGGLGATRAWWDPRLTDSLTVYFANDRAWYIERQWAIGQGASDIDDEIAALAPDDRELVDTFATSGGDRTARVYTSTWLADLFGDERWGGADPGTFTVTFNASGDVTRLVIATGNNP